MPSLIWHRKKKSHAITLVLLWLLSVSIASMYVNLAKSNPYLYNKQISPPIDMKPPTILTGPLMNNTVHTSNNISLTLTVSTPEYKSTYYLELGRIRYRSDWDDNDVTVYVWDGSAPTITDFSGNLTLEDIPEGDHNITFIAEVDGGSPDGLTWVWFNLESSVTVYFTVDTTAPTISILSLENRTCETSDIPLNFTINESATQLSYSLDGLDNVTIAGNTTLAGLSVGVHKVTVYGWDLAGNVGASETITFTMAEPEAFPVVPVATASAASISAVVVALLLYFKKHKR